MRRNAKFGCLLAALWLALAMAGASPQLHHALHEDAGSPEHACVIEHIGEGAFLFTPHLPVAIAPPELVLSCAAPASILTPSRDYRIALSRGPPFFSTSRTVAG